MRHGAMEENMRKLAGIVAISGVAVLALAAGPWMARGRGEISTDRGDAYFDIRADSRGNSTNAAGGAHFVIVDANEHPILGVDLPSGQGQFNTQRHDVTLRGPGGVRDASGNRRVPVTVFVHDGGSSGTDHIRVTAGNNPWEGDLEDGNLIVAPRQ
jgi:hypothetical protein